LLKNFEWRQPDRPIGLPKEQDSRHGGDCRRTAQEENTLGQLTLPLRELVHEVLFGTVIVSGLEDEWSLVVVFTGLHYRTIQIDTDPMNVPLLSGRENSLKKSRGAIDALMAIYRREWCDSPVLRRYGRVPHGDVHAVAQRILELAGGKL
jgi:hypothetical protein